MSWRSSARCVGTHRFGDVVHAGCQTLLASPRSALAVMAMIGVCRAPHRGADGLAA
jgi:hypothetical protein